MNNLEYLKSQPDADLLMQMLGLIPTTDRVGRHGTVRIYNEGCRCELCRQASSEYRSGGREPQPPPSPKGRRPPPQHGTYSGYTNLKCRCDPCREAYREYHRAYWHSRRSPKREVS